jgi:predicted ATPase
MAKYLSEQSVQRPAFLGTGPWDLKALNEITLIFGRNGSGKSLLLRKLRDGNKRISHYTSPERAGEISQDLNIMQEQINPDARANRRQQNLNSTYRQESVSRIGTLLNQIGYLAGFGGTLPFKLTDIQTFLQILLPDFQFRITKEAPHYEISRVDKGKEKITSVNALSSGESEILSLALDLLTICGLWEVDGLEQRVLLIDEPDMHLHPDLQQHLAHFLVQITDEYKVQILVATHSTTLLSSLGYYGGSKTSVIYLNNSVNKQKAIPFDDTLQEISTCLGGHALMGPLFSAPLLLVEGDDDYKIWSIVPRYNKMRAAVIPCRGSDQVLRYQKTLERLFSSLRQDTSSPVGYALLDGDRQLPQVEQSNIKFVKLCCKESENLYLTDEVLVLLGIDWEKAKLSIKSRSKEYGEKQLLLEQCDSWDRKNQDFKSIINELSRILDDKQLPWTLRVARCIGEKKPEGQLADFIGNEVIQALWK